MSTLTSIQNGKSIELPEPTEISVSDEIIWSSNTGRISSGKMVGDAIAEKQKLKIKWEYQTGEARSIIKAALTPGFYPLIINIDGTPYNLMAYRGTITSDALGQLLDGKYYFQSIECDLIEQ